MHVLVRDLNRVKFSVANQHIRKFNTIVNIYSVEKNMTNSQLRLMASDQKQKLKNPA